MLIWTLRKAPTTLTCTVCGLDIKPGESYCEGVEDGASSGAAKEPQRLHRECWELFVNKEGEPREALSAKADSF